MKLHQYFICCFKLICLITAISMASYWIHKFLRNDDITVIEYGVIKDSDSIPLPATYICFEDPFLMENQSHVKRNDSKYEGYSRYLKGERGFYQDYKDFLYDYRNMKITDYLANVTVLHHLKNKNHTNPMETFSSIDQCPFLTFENDINAMGFGSFYKCFGMKVAKRYLGYVSQVILGFKTSFDELVRKSEMIFVRFSYPGQLTLDLLVDQTLWKNLNDIKLLSQFKMDSIDIIKRRNKRNERCLENSTDYDNFMLKQAVEKVGCKAPYHNIPNDVPICDAYEKLSTFELSTSLHEKSIQPCDEMPQVPFKFASFGEEENHGLYPLLIAYPKKMKLITQQKAIDFHALIGNIGGYIGLFLGMFEEFCKHR